VQKHFFIICILIFTLPIHRLFAQEELDVTDKNTIHDTAFYIDYYDDFVVRTYISSKYTRYRIRDNSRNLSLDYKPNSKTITGVGFNYKWIGLNLGFGFGFLNLDNKLYGETKYIDIQSHFYLKRITIDFWGHGFSGYYLENTEKYFPDSLEYYKRKDIGTSMLGFDISYLFNHKNFTYKASFVQTAQQKKSAGSFIIGASINLSGINADTLIVPNIDTALHFINGYNYTSSGFINLSPKVGYSYHYVFKDKWFASASLLFGIGIGNAWYLDQTNVLDNAARSGFFSSSTFRFSMGYSHEEWFAGIGVINNQHTILGPDKNNNINYLSGNFRLYVAYRFL
jgi:hypothetical protein